MNKVWDNTTHLVAIHCSACNAVFIHGHIHIRTLLGRGRDMAISPTVVSLESHWKNRENVNLHYLFRQCKHPSQLTHFSQSTMLINVFTMLINVFICFLHWTSKQIVHA